MLSSLVVAAAMIIVGDPDGVVSTAPTGTGSVLVGAVAPTATDVPSVWGQAITPHGLSTDEQIDRWLSQRTEPDRPFADEGGPWAEDDREMHGEVSAAIGTGDFSAYSAAVSIPIGENGRISLSYSQSKNGYGYGSRYGYEPGGFGPGGFGLTGRGHVPGYGQGLGSSSVLDGGGVYPGRSSAASLPRDRRIAAEYKDEDRAPPSVED